MPRKRPDLKKRLSELRDEPAPQVEVTLLLNAEVFNTLKQRARHKRLPIEGYICDLLVKSLEDDAK